MSVSLPRADDIPLSSRLAYVWRAFLKHPTQVATVVPSSRQLIDNITNRECIQNAATVVELGPGAGGTTVGLLSQMRPDATLLAIEKTTAFEEALVAIDDPRLRIEFADALDLLDQLQRHDLGNVDVIVSGIPFSAIPAMAAKEILRSIYESLRPGGTFTAYQMHNDVDEYARPLFGPSRKDPVFWNLPPLTVYSWTKVVKDR